MVIVLDIVIWVVKKYLLICQILYIIDIQVGFISGPSVRNIGPSTFISGCRYQALVNLNKHVYLLLNNTIKITLKELPQMLRLKQNTAYNKYNLLEWEFPNHKISSYREIGFYQCVIFDKSRMFQEVRSGEVFLKLSGES